MKSGLTTDNNRLTNPIKASNFILVIVYCFLLIGIADLQAQDTLSFSYKTFGLEIQNDNVIQNAAYLDSFFENLYQLKTRGDRKINIIHIGDSHVQGEYLTQPVRKNFQEHFGNAGRGLIVPGNLAGTNEAYNIVTASNISWEAKRIIYPDQPLPIGIGGITISTDKPNATLDIYMKDLWLDYSFTTMDLFFLNDSASFSLSVKDTADHELKFIKSITDPTIDNYAHITLPDSLESIRIETIKSSPNQSQTTIFGVNLENGKNGILYHGIGVNGAKYKHFNEAKFFSQQTSILKPDLFIISLGTNEALDFPYLDKNFYQHIEKLITSLRKNNPKAKFILVTPPIAFRDRTKNNPGISKIREQIIQYAVEYGLAFWDIYRVMGGEQYMEAWRQAGLQRTDGIHFSKEGYEYLGDLLYKAIIKSYNQYVSVRHP